MLEEFKIYKKRMKVKKDINEAMENGDVIFAKKKSRLAAIWSELIFRIQKKMTKHALW